MTVGTLKVAKATSKALDVSEKVGRFVAKVIGEPVECAVSIVTKIKVYGICLE